MTGPALAERPSAAHELPVHEAVLLLETDRARGLSDDEARARLERTGPNVLPRARRRGPLHRLALQLHHPLIYVLLASAAIAAGLGEHVDAGVILGVVLVNAAIGFVQEGRAERALAALAATIAAHATVIRDGSRRRVQAEEIVPGDLLVIEAGDRIAADLRLCDEADVEIDESMLTGESVPVAKVVDPVPAQAGVGDRTNMAFSGTFVTRGQGLGVVVATGADTEIGLIHRLVGEAGGIATPLTRKMARFSRILTVVILALAAVTYAVGRLRGESVADMFVAAVALAVGAIPEGLPAAITITLAIGVARMARRHAIVRRLPAVETLGSTTVICTDKTGTLTENRMTVEVVAAGGERFELDDGRLERALEGSPLHECLLAGALCNDSRAEEEGGESLGDPTEAALVASALAAGIDVEAAHRRMPRLGVIPFESERRFMATLHDRGDGHEPVLFVKGAAETVLASCSSALAPGGTHEPLHAAAVMAEVDELARRGLRVLAMARGDLPAGTVRLDAERAPSGLTFLGLQAMMDPPRAAAIDAVAACRRAGIAVKMITGDHPATAQVIARRIGLDGADLEVMTGRDVELCPAAELPAAAARTAVFARVSAEQKLRLVEALQRRGEIVAMTGDGVNDAPALRRADIGVAMGRGGTEVAREASDVVLTDDDFASIAAAVEEGRRIFDNLTKFIVWTLPTNMGEGLVILTAIAAGVALPILPTQILWINMTTAVALGLMLAFEAKEPGLMERPPRDPARPLLTADLVGRILLVSMLLLGGAFFLFEWERSHGASLEQARTVAVNVFVAGQALYLLNCRSLTGSMLRVGALSNRPLLAGLAIMLALQLLFTYAPPMHALFESVAIDPGAWLRIAVAALAVFASVGAEKWLRARRAR